MAPAFLFVVFDATARLSRGSGSDDDSPTPAPPPSLLLLLLLLLLLSKLGWRADRRKMRVLLLPLRPLMLLSVLACSRVVERGAGLRFGSVWRERTPSCRVRARDRPEMSMLTVSVKLYVVINV
jgi:hypothetical protein